MYPPVAIILGLTLMLIACAALWLLGKHKHAKKLESFRTAQLNRLELHHRISLREPHLNLDGCRPFGR